MNQYQTMLSTYAEELRKREELPIELFRRTDRVGQIGLELRHSRDLTHIILAEEPDSLGVFVWGTDPTFLKHLYTPANDIRSLYVDKPEGIVFRRVANEIWRTYKGYDGLHVAIHGYFQEVWDDPNVMAKEGNPNFIQTPTTIPSGPRKDAPIPVLIASR